MQYNEDLLDNAPPAQNKTSEHIIPLWKHKLLTKLLLMFQNDVDIQHG